MSNKDGSGESFDPRSWAAPAATKTDGNAGGIESVQDNGSFDPKTWRSSTSSDGQDAAAPDAAARITFSRRRLAAVASGLVLLTSLAGAVQIFKPEPMEVEAPTPVGVTEAPAGQVQSASERIVTVAAASDIPDALIAAEIDPEEARAAAAQALSGLGSSAGEIRVVLTFANAVGATRLIRLEATRLDGSGIAVVRNGPGFASQPLEAQLTMRIRPVSGEMDGDSFYSSAVAAGVTDSLISDFAAAFGYELDFAREVSTGDRFEAVIEESVNPTGQTVGPPRLLFVSMRTSQKALRFYRFQPPGSEIGWFDDNGRSNVRSLMRTPLDGARISSRFGLRMHPVFRTQRLHRGTDFAAPTGTRVYAAADGVVQSATPDRCAGNMLILQHDNGWVTRYFHLSAYGPQIARGVRVRQNEVVAAVGNTGTCTTGPHLHFELIVNGEHQDPMSVDTGTGTVLEGGALEAFRRFRDRVDASRSTARR